jgi:hypothetical protein
VTARLTGRRQLALEDQPDIFLSPVFYTRPICSLPCLLRADSSRNPPPKWGVEPDSGAAASVLVRAASYTQSIHLPSVPDYARTGMLWRSV